MPSAEIKPDVQKLIDELILANLEELKRQADRKQFLGLSPRVLAEDARLLGLEDVAEMLGRWLQRSSNISYFYELMKGDGDLVVEYERVSPIPGRKEIALQRRDYASALKDLYAEYIHSRQHLEVAGRQDYEKALAMAEEEDESDFRTQEVAAIHALKDLDAAWEIASVQKNEIYRREAPMRVFAIEFGRRGDVDRSRQILQMLVQTDGEDWHRRRAVALGLGGWEPWQGYPLVYW